VFGLRRNPFLAQRSGFRRTRLLKIDESPRELCSSVARRERQLGLRLPAHTRLPRKIASFPVNSVFFEHRAASAVSRQAISKSVSSEKYRYSYWFFLLLVNWRELGSLQFATENRYSFVLNEIVGME
jgi:hypothetical protein